MNRIVAKHAMLGEQIEDRHLVLAADERKRIAEAGILDGLDTGPAGGIQHGTLTFGKVSGMKVRTVHALSGIVCCSAVRILRCRLATSLRLPRHRQQRQL